MDFGLNEPERVFREYRDLSEFDHYPLGKGRS